MKRTYDIAIIGLGAIGSSTLMHLAKQGSRVIGIDRYAPPHDHGSSHGETRITRLSICEGAAYIALVKRSHELWRELEAETGTEILTQTGGLLVDEGTVGTMHGVSGFARTTAILAEQFGIPHEVLSVKDAHKSFPDFSIGEGSFVYFEPSAGFVRPEKAIEAQLNTAIRYGADILTFTQVSGVRTTSGGSVEIKTSNGTVKAEQCLLSAGPWIKDFLPPQSRHCFKITRQVLHWVPVENGAYPLKTSPIFIWCYGAREEDIVYGFPSLDGRTIKVASECFTDSGSPENIDRNVSLEEQRTFVKDKLLGRLHCISGNPVRSSVCLYTVAHGHQFIITPHPEMPSVLIASCCSGHGFKHSSALGEVLAAKLREDVGGIDLSAFGKLAEI